MRLSVLAAAGSLAFLPGSAFSASLDYEPSLPPGAGYRVDGGTLKIWTGTPCAGITRITLRLDSGFANSTRMVLEAKAPAAVEHFSFDAPPPGFSVKLPFREGVDWRKARTVSVNLDGGTSQWSSVVRVAEVVEGSPKHDRDTYLFDTLGWYDKTEVARRNGKTFLTVCTADPDGQP